MQELPYRTTRILKALGNPLRFRILSRLAERPATPSQLAAELHRPLPMISRTLAQLRDLDLVWYRPRTPWLIYQAKYDAVRPFLAAADRCAASARVQDPATAPSTTPADDANAAPTGLSAEAESDASPSSPVPPGPAPSSRPHFP